MASVTRQRSQEKLSRALDELKNSERKLRQVIDTIPTLALSILPDGSNEFLNKRWHEYTGFRLKNPMVQVGRLPSIQRIEPRCWRNDRGFCHRVTQAEWRRVSAAMTECFAGFSCELSHYV